MPPAVWDAMRAATAASPLDRIPTVEAFRARLREAWSASERSAVTRSALPPEPGPVVAPVVEPRVDVLPVVQERAHVEAPPEYEAPTVMEYVPSGVWESESEPPEGATILQEVYDDAGAHDEEDEGPSATVALTVEAPAESAWNVTGAGDESTLIVEVPAPRASIDEPEPEASPAIAPTDLCVVRELPYGPATMPAAAASSPPVVREVPVVARPSAVTDPSPRHAMSTDERRTVIALVALGGVIVVLFVAIVLSLARG